MAGAPPRRPNRHHRRAHRGVDALLTKADPRKVLFLSAPNGHEDRWQHLGLIEAAHGPNDAAVELHIPVNRLAERHGTTDSGSPAISWFSRAGRSRTPIHLRPPPGSRLPSSTLTSSWSKRPRPRRGRAGPCRGQVAVDTRMDLWRLHGPRQRSASTSSPGLSFARECVEALRFGTPILVPEVPGRRHHARAPAVRRSGTQLNFQRRLLIERHGGAGAAASAAARRYAEPTSASPNGFIASMT